MDDGGTYLEDFLQSVELLPNDIRRDFEVSIFFLSFFPFKFL